MVIDLLTDKWFTPKSLGNMDEPENERMKIRIHPLTGNEEMDLISKGEDRFLANVLEIKRPFQLKDRKGGLRDMKVIDIKDQSALKPLFYEILGYVAKLTLLDEEGLKN